MRGVPRHYASGAKAQEYRRQSTAIQETENPIIGMIISIEFWKKHENLKSMSVSDKRKFPYFITYHGDVWHKYAV